MIGKEKETAKKAERRDSIEKLWEKHNETATSNSCAFKNTLSMRPPLPSLGVRKYNNTQFP